MPASVANSGAPLHQFDVVVLLGIDYDDAELMQQQKAVMAPFLGLAGVCTVRVRVFGPAELDHGKGSAPVRPTAGVCHLWDLLAQDAVREHGCQLVVLLGAP